MQQYHDLLRHVLQTGSRQSNRTGVDTIFTSGEMLKIDLSEGFPVLTTRKYPWEKPIAEMTGFLNAVTNAKEFRDLGCPFWDANANENEEWLNNPNRTGQDDLGPIYGYQSRNWLRYDGEYLDQFATVLSELFKNPTSRRLMVSHWRPDQFELMALPPCHVSYQFIADTTNNELNMMVYMRSNDLFLGAPANIVQYAWLLEVVAHVTQMKAKWLNYAIADAHIYVNHVDQVLELIGRTPYHQPTLQFKKDFMDAPEGVGPLAWIENLRAEDFELVGYQSHGPIKAPMAV
jgi:thymidylate synthase